MVTRTYLLRGDKADNGAVIVGGSANSTYDGIPTAREGDPVYCPVCKQTGVIVCVGSRWSSQDDGKEEALSGDLCACGCNPPPIFHASRPYVMVMTVDDVARHSASEAVGFAATASASLGRTTHDQQIQILDEVTGEPLANRRYRLTSDSRVHEGQTDGNGMTERVYADREITMRLEIFGEDA